MMLPEPLVSVVKCTAAECRESNADPWAETAPDIVALVTESDANPDTETEPDIVAWVSISK